MSLVNIPAYEGSSPFIYVYYAEDDTRIALPVLARLYNEGLRMWSWNGCPQPTDIRVTQRISSCSALLIFLSENLDRDIHRGNFEAMEALRCNKVKYFVRISDMELSFDWGKSDANIVIDYARSNEAAFWLSVYDSDIIESCRGVWPSNPVKLGMSVFDTIDSSELSDEYSSILNIIGKAPTLDRSGSPVNADDIALFAGAGEQDEAAGKNADFAQDLQLNDLNQKSMQDLFGMLDEISLSTRQRAEELQQSAEKRRAEQEKAAMERAALPFEQESVKTHVDEIPAPALSFDSSAMAVEGIAAEMFGVEFSEEFFEEAALEEDASKEVIIIEDEKEDEVISPSFEEFIDDLSGVNTVDEPAPEDIKEEDIIEEVPLLTSPKTVEIAEETALLPPASGSLTGFTLPDDNYMNTVYVYHDVDDEPVLSAADKAAAAEKSRKQFESALENAAFKVTGRIVARPSKGDEAVGLRVRRPKVIKLAAHAKAPKTVKVFKAVRPAAVPEQNEKEQRRLSRAERREQRRKRRESPKPDPTPEILQPHKVTVTPAPMRGEMPSSFESTVVKNPPTPAPEPAPLAEETTEAAPRRKKRHPHNSSGLVGLLKELRNQKNAEEQEEIPQSSADTEE